MTDVAEAQAHPTKAPSAWPSQNGDGAETLAAEIITSIVNFEPQRKFWEKYETAY